MESKSETRIAGPRDREAVLHFLEQHPDSTLFLRGNLQRVGLEDRGQRYQGTYAAAFEGDTVKAVAAHYWNGALIMEAPDHLAAVLSAAVGASGRAVLGLLGRCDQVRAARALLDLSAVTPTLESEEALFALDLAQLRVPAPLAEGRVTCRLPREDELPLLVDWRCDYRIETLGASPGEDLRQHCQAEIHALQAEEQHWVLTLEDRPVAYSAFNSTVDDCVQVGGVWTPPEQRGRGHARAVVAGSLLVAREGGATRSVLFTENPAAERAYRSIGFEEVGDYGVLLFEARSTD